ncbi:hypothetical protein [Lactiplantibacillus carotarum]|uniref:hypothetical protein n=1 Tax=Lactiplantibacillus carotarum TaxID=2993456 RepID=UPI00298EF061|nr:hypothetical protein [Lactiplantibacillus carotarum]
MTILGLEVGSWADWASAVGTVSAVVVTLVIQHNAGKIKLSVSAGNGVMQGKLTHYTVSVTNIGQRVVSITDAGFLLPNGVAFSFIDNTYPERLEPGDISVFLADSETVRAAAVKLQLEDKKVKSYVRYSGNMYKGKKIIL